MEKPLVVQAEYPFKGENNDELCFKKGDLITITQKEEGGWWEGTLNDKTGWFPSNYVVEYKAPLPAAETIRLPEEIQEYRSVVLNDLLESERALVAELQGLLENFLEPLKETKILNADEYAQLMSNFVEVVKLHEELLLQIEECHDRVGKLFLTKAPVMKQVHQSYCASHPKAIVILDRFKDELEKFMESQGAATPGLLVLTTGLSKPFRRLDKYSAMLQELERHMENSHPDRGDTQRSVSVYKDIAAACSATRRQKELELQVLTGPVRGWQGQELSTLGDIIHMGSVAVGPDHRDRYFVLFPHTLLILSVSQRMSAFIYEGKLPLTGIVVNRLEDTDTLKNAFEISGNLIERIVAVCQGPNEANKWVELLNASNSSIPVGIKRQLSNLSNSSYSGIGGNPAINLQTPLHMSPPANLGMLSQRMNQTSMLQQQHGAINPSQHKRSLSFNHHLNYNQYSHNQQVQQQQQQQQQAQAQAQSLGNQLVPLSHKSNSVQIPSSILTRPLPAPPIPVPPVNTAVNARIENTKANWNITNLRPTPPLRPTLLNTNQSNSVSGSANSQPLPCYRSGRKYQPTFEEDALVLRVFEAYCAAYQSNARNTIHSALQPWTPCLPIRSGKLKGTRPFSSSNPHLPFLASMSSQHGFVRGVGGSGGANSQQISTNSLNSSFIWREANPNNFNLYSSSVSALNGPTHHRSSVSGSTGIDYRALSEERATRKSLNRFKSGFGSGYDNVFSTPLLPRKNKNSTSKLSSNFLSSKETQNPKSMNQRSKSNLCERYPSDAAEQKPLRPGLYDRRLNRSFEASSQRYAGYGAAYIMGVGLDSGSLRRSTPQLIGDENDGPTEQQWQQRAFLDNTDGDCKGKNIGENRRLSGAWCCGLENEDMTPTLRQLWTDIRNLQQDMSQMKLQINEERALRIDLHRMLMQHLEASSGNTPKC